MPQQIGGGGRLPPGWVAQRDPATGNTFYANKYTSQTQWEFPRGPAPGGPRGAGLDSPRARRESAGQQLEMTPAGAVPRYTPSTPAFQAPAANRPAPRVSGRRRALFVGINYPGTSAALKGCINDVRTMQSLLNDVYGFGTDRNTMHALTDDGGRAIKSGCYWAGNPTRANIIQELNWLVSDVRPGDILFFHYSGHGAQEEDPNGWEEDGMNETIIPSDFQRAGMINDDVLSEVLCCRLPDGARLIALMDACHSGTGLDLPFVIRGSQCRETTNPLHTLGDVMLISGCEDDDTSADARPRYGAPAGAMTTAFNAVVRQGGNPSLSGLIQQMHRHLDRGGFTQRPQLSTSQYVDPSQRRFGMQDIAPNRNQRIGRTVRKKFPPRPRPLSRDDPLFDMLSTAGLLYAGLIGLQLAGGAVRDIADQDCCAGCEDCGNCEEDCGNCEEGCGDCDCFGDLGNAVGDIADGAGGALFGE